MVRGQKVEIEMGGRTHSLLDHTVLVSGVSGGSILAAHYAAFGDETLSRFELNSKQPDSPRIGIWLAGLLEPALRGSAAP